MSKSRPPAKYYRTTGVSLDSALGTMKEHLSGAASGTMNRLVIVTWGAGVWGVRSHEFTSLNCQFQFFAGRQVKVLGVLLFRTRITVIDTVAANRAPMTP